MNQMYTVMDCLPFRDTPYGTYLGTLSGIGIRSQGKFKARAASGLTCLSLQDHLRRIMAGRAHDAAARMGSGTA